MVKSIFEIENRLDIQHEFKKMVKVLHGDRIGNYSDSNSYMGMIERLLCLERKFQLIAMFCG